jgi:hypothetical protein
MCMNVYIDNVRLVRLGKPKKSGIVPPNLIFNRFPWCAIRYTRGIKNTASVALVNGQLRASIHLHMQNDNKLDNRFNLKV